MGKNQSYSSNALTLMGDVFAIVGSLMKSRADRGAEKLHTLSTATRDYAATLTDMPQLRAKVGAASDSIDEVANYAVHTDIEHMFVDATTFARKHPMATLGFAAAAGVLAVAFLRSSAEVPPPVKTRKASAKKKSPVKARAAVKARAVVKQRNGKKVNSGQAHATQ